MPRSMWNAQNMQKHLVLTCCAAVFIVSSALLSRLPPPPRHARHEAPQRNRSALIEVDMSATHPVSPTLFGIFFEEINYAGDGGIYAEMVNDRSFDAFATDEVGVSGTSKAAEPPSDWIGRAASPWKAVGNNTRLAPIFDTPLGAGNPVALSITAGGAGGSPREAAGVANLGYWGISVRPGQAYHLSVCLKLPAAINGQHAEVTVALQSSSGADTHAQLRFNNVTSEWQRFEGVFNISDSAAAEPHARLAVLFSGFDSLLVIVKPELVDVLSLFPEANVQRGAMNPWPFRSDLLQMLRDLQPRFVRFPGGCYVEGDTLKNRFQWKKAVGPSEERPGHWNLWGYSSTDGLGLFEYMQLAEELGAEPVWVINNGIAHADSVPTAALQPYIQARLSAKSQSVAQDALDSVEFVTGPPDSQWGALRAAMGHPQPWVLNYLAVGNEDCGKPYYLENYIAFFEALRTQYPHLRLISNCLMGDSAPSDLYDWHVYTDPATMFKLSTAFDELRPSRDAHVFASEYAVTTGGGRGNLIGAIAEAGFMTGLERNSEAVEMAAYAPLFVHAATRDWQPTWPTNLIVFDNRGAYGAPSYHVQRLFARHQGSRYVETRVDGGAGSATVAASATCETDACERLSLKVVNMAQALQHVKVSLSGLGGDGVFPSGNLTIISGDDPLAENSFQDPFKVAPKTAMISSLGPAFQLEAPPLSLSVLVLDIHKPADPTAVA